MWFSKQRKPIEKLVDGYKKFQRTTYVKERQRYRRLIERGQRPKIMIIACSDSRVSPTTIFEAPPGSLFIARNVANIVPPHDTNGVPRSIGAAVEYAVKVLNVTDIVVKGHARCGGVAALVNHEKGIPHSDYIKSWVEVAAPARALFPANFDSLSDEEKGRVAEQAVIQNSVMNLSGFPWVRERLESGALAVHGWHFDILHGQLTRLDHESGEWGPVR